LRPLDRRLPRRPLRGPRAPSSRYRGARRWSLAPRPARRRLNRSAQLRGQRALAGTILQRAMYKMYAWHTSSARLLRWRRTERGSVTEREVNGVHGWGNEAEKGVRG